jgi:hypothetical protein
MSAEGGDLLLAHANDSVHRMRDEPCEERAVNAPLETSTAVLGCDVSRARPERDCLAEDLSAHPLREDDPRRDPPETIGAQDGAYVCARTHADMHCRNPSVTQLVEVAPSGIQSRDARLEAAPPQSWHEQSELAFRPPDGKSRIEKKDRSGRQDGSFGPL